MPCHGPTEAEMLTERKHINQKKYGVYASDLDIATRVACDLAKGKRNKLTALWIEEHEKLDRQRAIEKEEDLKEERIKARVKDYERRIRLELK